MAMLSCNHMIHIAKLLHTHTQDYSRRCCFTLFLYTEVQGQIHAHINEQTSRTVSQSQTCSCVQVWFHETICGKGENEIEKCKVAMSAVNKRYTVYTG